MKYFSSLQTPKPNAKPENKGDFNGTSMWKLVQELSTVQKAYQLIISSLPRGKSPFCSLVDNYTIGMCVFCLTLPVSYE